jgi:hypothetical protein
MNEQATKKRKIIRSYVRDLLKQLKDLGVDTVANDGGEILLTHAGDRSEEVTMDKAVSLLIAEAPK